jgi:hypothetical protein
MNKVAALLARTADTCGAIFEAIDSHSFNWKPISLCPHSGGCSLTSSDRNVTKSLRLNRALVDPTSCKFLISSTTGCHLDDRRCSRYLNGGKYSVRVTSREKQQPGAGRCARL